MPSQLLEVVSSKGRAGADGDVTRSDAIRAGRRAFLQAKRISLVAVAAELGIGRATMYRWFGSKDQFISHVLLSLAMDTIDGQFQARSINNGRDFAQAWTDTLQVIMDHPGMTAFLSYDPRRALTILTGPGSVVHQGFVDRLTSLIEEHCPGAIGTLSSEDLAYALVRLAEAFCYTDITTGRPSELSKAKLVFARLMEESHAPSH